MLNKLTRRISAFFFALFAVVFLFPSNTLATETNNLSLDLKKVPLNAVTLEKAVIAGLTVNENSICSYTLKSAPENVYQCLNALQINNISKVKKEANLESLPRTGETPKKIQKVVAIPTSLPTLVPTSTPIATPTPLPASTPQVIQSTPPSGSLSADTYFNMINNHRATKGLPAFEKHPELCGVAASRGPELEGEIFGNSYIHAGFRKRNLPYWATENMIGYPAEEIGFSWWMSSPVHRQAIESTDYKYACGVCSGKACAMLFTSFTPKQI